VNTIVRILTIKVIAALYTFVYVAALFWSWGTLLFANPAVEHLLPAFIFIFVCFPLSLMIECLVETVPSLANNAVVMQAIMTGLGAIQVLAIWCVALRFKFRAMSKT